MKNFKFLGLVLAVFVLLSPVLIPVLVPASVPVVSATHCGTTVPDDPSVPCPQITDVEGILLFMNNIFKWFFYIVLTLSSIMLLYAAFKYIWSKGDPGEVETAKNIIIYAVIALVVSGLAYAVPGIIIAFLEK